ncbi:hypothetical protein [Agromyces bauzanensis]
MKPVRTVTAALLLAAGAAVFTAAPAYADVIPVDPPEGAPAEVCAELDSTKIDTVGDPLTVEITADPGYLITGYCVKAGSENQGDGPLYYEVVPPTESVTISYPGGKAVSHYSYTQEKVATTPPTTPPATEPPATTPPATPPAETTPPAGGGGDGGVTLAETGFENGWLAFVGLGALAVGAAIAVPRMVAKRR